MPSYIRSSAEVSLFLYLIARVVANRILEAHSDAFAISSSGSTSNRGSVSMNLIMAMMTALRGVSELWDGMISATCLGTVSTFAPIEEVRDGVVATEKHNTIFKCH